MTDGPSPRPGEAAAGKPLTGAALGKFYTPGLQDQLVDLVRKGNTRAEAAKRCKIAPRPFGYWMARGTANLKECAEAEEREAGAGDRCLDDFGVFCLEILPPDHHVRLNEAERSTRGTRRPAPPEMGFRRTERRGGTWALDVIWVFRYLSRVPNTIWEETFDSPTEFVDALCPRNLRWRGRPSSWVFRGHRDANWALIPPALRAKDVYLGVGPNVPEGRRSTELEQIRGEHELLTEFLFYADRSGLKIPNDFAYTPEAQRQEYRLEERVISGEQYWPPTKWLPWVALAQHYHIPTRLLDWSASAKVACLFAVKDVKTSSKQGPQLCVWALDVEWLEAAWRGVFVEFPEITAPACKQAASERLRFNELMSELYDNTLVRVVRAPRGSNPRLHAQHGLFTVVQRCNLSTSSEPDTRPLDEVIQMRSRQFQHPLQRLPDAPPVLYKLCIDVESAPELMRLLYMEGIDPALILPGFEGAAQAVLGARGLDRLF